MSGLKFSTIQTLIQAEVLQWTTDHTIQFLLTDSRKVKGSDDALFFAIEGTNHDAHQFISDLYQNGVRNFIVEKAIVFDAFPDANILKVDSSIQALQSIASHHRSSFSIPVLGITGSNGKTVVKEWLAEMLADHYRVCKSPKSYNSQIGVPLSVWALSEHHNFAVFEAGISKMGEMEFLERVIQPNLGLITNIGTAHEEGFPSMETKLEEKLKLFSSVDCLFYRKDHTLIDAKIQASGIPSFSWSERPGADLKIESDASGFCTISSKEEKYRLKVPFQDDASLENIRHCICLLHYLGYEPAHIQSQLDQLHPVQMRLEFKQGIHHTLLIDDSYNNDLGGLEIALDLLANNHQHRRKTVILSDIPQTGLSARELYGKVNQFLAAASVDRLIGVGPELKASSAEFTVPNQMFESTASLLLAMDELEFENELILIKGARTFQFEMIVRRLEEKLHQTRLEVDLNAIAHNLNFYRSKLSPSTRIMVMVKALAYGSGIGEIANVLQFQQVDYLGVAYSDEGVQLRQEGIHTPIMVMNPSDADIDKLVRHRLEPEVFSLAQLQQWNRYLQQTEASLSVHININTGMNRLGFELDEVDQLITFFTENDLIKPVSVFTHLAGADESIHERYSRNQLNQFVAAADRLESVIGKSLIKHALNSAGIIRYPEFQMDMVRLGIGLHGIEVNEKYQDKLNPVSQLKTVISQIKEIKAGDTIGYGRKGEAEKAMKIATVAIGYADGYSRAFSRGKGAMLVAGKRAPVIGNVCMDMCMLDVTEIDASVGDTVIVFGENLPIQEMAKTIDTIPYELLTNVSDRVKRVYFSE